MDENHVHILGRKNRTYMIRKPIVSVIQIPHGPDKGMFALVAHGKNDINEMTVVELRVFERFEDARIVYSELCTGKIQATDIPQFEITPAMLLTWRGRYASLLM